ncbi:MAG: pantothenate kinase [Bacteroidales bacterium]|nr:MAG: pantothenate kinase [Bacteroidales bacterium]
MINLVIDIGNTQSKIAVFEDSQIVDFQVKKSVTISCLKDCFHKYKIDNTIISSVSVSVREISSFLEANSCLIEFDANTYQHINFDYQTLNTLGKDRIAGVIGATEFLPDDDLLVVDIGSCITYDVLTKDSVFVGGNIAPGLYMRLKAMHDYTAKLPMVYANEAKELLAKNTKDALFNGAFWGIVFEINTYFDKLQEVYPNIKVVLTGGDAHYFEKSIKQCNFVNSKLVLVGLNKVIVSVVD